MESNNITLPIPLSLRKILSGSLMVAGTAIGAGMLGLPFVTTKSGLLGAYFITLLVGLFMMITGFLFVHVILKMPQGANLLSIANRYLGNKATVLTGAMFLFLYYCFLMAYFSGSTALIQDISYTLFQIELPFFLAQIIFVTPLAFILYRGARLVDKSNIWLMSSMGLFYFLILLVGCNSMKQATPPFFSIKPMLGAIPILFGAFGYHNVLPSLCDYLQKDRKSIFYSVLFGTLLTMIVYLAWQTVILTSIDAQTMQECMEGGKSIAYALQRHANHPYLLTFVAFFSFSAIATSALGVGLSLVDVFRDGFELKNFKCPRILLIALGLFPPLMLASFDPTIFYKALGLAGGFGESYLNGILPIVLVWISLNLKGQSYPRKLVSHTTFTILLFFALGVMVVELLHLFT